MASAAGISAPAPALPESLRDRLTVRPATAEDVDGLHALMVANDQAVIGRSMTTRDEIHSQVASLSAAVSTAQVVIERDGVLVAWGHVQQIHPDHLIDDVQVHPAVDAATTDQVFAWASAWSERVARDNLTLDGVDRVQVGEWSFAEDTARAQRLRDLGYTENRAFIQMTRPLNPDEEFPSAAPGVVIRPARIDEDDPASSEATLMHDLITESFADHYNYSPTAFPTWWQRRKDDPGFDPALWFLAELDGVPVGAMLLNRELEAEENAGYVNYLGTVRAGRGRGVARSLLSHCFASNRADGLGHTKLWVDADSPTGATRLYESVGMTRDQVVLDWQKWVGQE